MISIRALLIDPYERKITEVWTLPKMSSYCQLMSHPSQYLVSIVEMVQISQHHRLLLDEDGFTRVNVPVFKIKDHLFCGRSLVIVRSEALEKDFSCTLSVGGLSCLVEFTDLVSTGNMEEATSTEIDGMVVIVGGPPILGKRQQD